eukprot:1157160-Prymnesium_polylepis.1
MLLTLKLEPETCEICNKFCLNRKQVSEGSASPIGRQRFSGRSFPHGAPTALRAEPPTCSARERALRPRRPRAGRRWQARARPASTSTAVARASSPSCSGRAARAPKVSTTSASRRRGGDGSLEGGTWRPRGGGGSELLHEASNLSNPARACCRPGLTALPSPACAARNRADRRQHLRCAERVARRPHGGAGDVRPRVGLGREPRDDAGSDVVRVG